MGPMMVCADMAQKAVHKHNASKMGLREVADSQRGRFRRPERAQDELLIWEVGAWQRR